LFSPFVVYKSIISKSRIFRNYTQQKT
jgi:hypothetical protein